MLGASVRYVCLALMLLCNALFFWDVEAKTDGLLALAFGRSDVTVTRTEVKQVKAYGMSAHPERSRH